MPIAVRPKTKETKVKETKPKETKKRFTFKAEESEEEPSVEEHVEEEEEEEVDPLEGVEDVDEVQDIAQDIFDAAYKENRRKYAKVASRFPDKTHVFIRLYNEETKQKEWVPLVYGKDNMASDIAMGKVIEALRAHDFKVDHRAETRR